MGGRVIWPDYEPWEEPLPDPEEESLLAMVEEEGREHGQVWTYEDWTEQLALVLDDDWNDVPDWMSELEAASAAGRE